LGAQEIVRMDHEDSDDRIDESVVSIGEDEATEAAEEPAPMEGELFSKSRI
jgi:hypothetical protein